MKQSQETSRSPANANPWPTCCPGPVSRATRSIPTRRATRRWRMPSPRRSRKPNSRLPAAADGDDAGRAERERSGAAAAVLEEPLRRDRIEEAQVRFSIAVVVAHHGNGAAVTELVFLDPPGGAVPDHPDA